MTFEEIAKQANNLTIEESQVVAKKVIKEYETVLKSMNEQLKDVYAKLSGERPEDYFNKITKYNRLTMIIEDLQKKYLSAAKLIGKETVQAAESAISNSYYRNIYAMNWSEPANGVFVALSDSVIDVSVYGTQEAWKAIADTKTFGLSENYLPQSGTLIEQLIVRRNPEVIQAIEQAVRAGLMAGESYAKTAKRIKKIMEADAYKALRIVNTETHRNTMAGQYASSQALKAQGVPVKRQIVSVLDKRTREQSAIVDGQFEDENGYFTYPNGALVAIPGNSGYPQYDINDREAVIMSVDGTSPELRRARSPVKNPETGKYETDIIGWTSFNDWMKANNLVYKNGKMVYEN